MFCFEICTPEGRRGEKGGSANSKTKHTVLLTSESISPLLFRDLQEFPSWSTMNIPSTRLVSLTEWGSLSELNAKEENEEEEEELKFT